ncbi:MAG: efflux RND transporter periplasmic adaptor subunit [Gammaproteobacteria bacterium]|nr:efflux RND transporter periplasmic adaptor subunit [Gammaproteobacteria bacterium]
MLHATCGRPVARFFVVSSCCMMLSACEQTPEGQQREPAVRVQVAAAETRALDETVRGIGTLRARQTVEISPEIAGKLTRIGFEEGEYVEADTVLFEIDTRKLERELEAREAALEAALARRENAKRELARIERLFRQQAASEDRRDQAGTALRAARAAVDEMTSRVQLARERLADARIKAPFAGSIAEAMVDVGDFVQPATHLATLYETETLELEFRVPERYSSRIETGQSVDITVAAYPDERFRATTTFVSPSVNEATRDFLVKARLANEGGKLKPGSFATALLTVATRTDALVVPEEALIATREGYLVFVVDDDGKAVRRQVEIGLRKPGVVQVTSGLEIGERVVRTGHMRVADGSALEIVEDEGIAAGERGS